MVLNKKIRDTFAPRNQTFNDTQLSYAANDCFAMIPIFDKTRAA